MLSVMNTRTRAMPRSLTHPAGIVFLDPANRVSREELDRRDRRWRAMRERAYARAWSEDATLVGSVRRYAAASVVLREWEERTLARHSGAAAVAAAATYNNGMPTSPSSSSNASFALIRRGTTNTLGESSTLYSQRMHTTSSDPQSSNAAAAPTGRSTTGSIRGGGPRRVAVHRLSHLLHGGGRNASGSNGNSRHRPRKFKETVQRWVKSVRV